VGITSRVAAVAPFELGVPPLRFGPVYGADVGFTVAVIWVALTTLVAETATVT
jgi:hypothetical protein